MEKQGRASLPPYRPAEALPFELAQHCGIYFEEKLYTQALNLLSNILVSGAPAWSRAFVPSSAHLAIAVTLLVHPTTTTRAKTAEEKEAPSAALRLLRLVNTYVGSISARFDIAFSFTHFVSSRHGTRRRVTEEELSNELQDDGMKPINSNLAQSASLWSRAEDFWHAVGWAFNCSVLHPERWERWHLWLQFMCEVLEDDWEERLRLFEDAMAEDTDPTASRQVQHEQILKESLIFTYLTSGSVGYGRSRRILRAILADGSPSSVNEFHEVFKNELKMPKKETENLKKRAAQVNIDEDQYGDYLSNEDDDGSENSAEIKKEEDAPRRSKRSKKTSRKPDSDADIGLDFPGSLQLDGSVSSLGGFTSLALRQRLMSLLSDVSDHLPKSFITLEDLYHLFVENIRHLSLPAFHAFISPSTLPHFSPEAQTTLCEFMLFHLRESSAPDSGEEYLNQEKLEKCFLPYAASSTGVIDNTKMSIALESLLVLLAEGDLLEVTPELKKAVEEGIAARAAKAQIDNRKNRKVDNIAYSWLMESAERLMFLVNSLLV